MVERLAPGIYQLELGWRVPFGANAYLVDDGDVTLIDAGFPVNARSIREELREIGVPIASIDRVLITHYDLDHVGGLARLAPALDAPVYVGTADLAIMTGDDDPPFWHHKGLFHRGLRSVYRLPSSLSYRPIGDREVVGGFTGYHTPGHNPGHTVYVHHDRGLVLFGDLVWEEAGGLTIPFWLDSYDMPELRASLRRFAAAVEPFEIAGVGHGTPIRSDGFAALRRLVDELGDESDWWP